MNRTARRRLIASVIVLLSCAGVITAVSAVAVQLPGGPLPTRIVPGTSDTSGTSGTLGAQSTPGAQAAWGAADGAIADEWISLDDDTHPALAGTDPALVSAMRDAAASAADDGIVFRVTSGWRSAGYQQSLLDQAIARDGETEARAYVATPETSSHVTGTALDIGQTDADYWLIQHGSEFGVCQTYANEIWHFELAVAPGGECPAPRPDAAS